MVTLGTTVTGAPPGSGIAGSNIGSRFVQNVRETLGGVLPGMFMLGKAGLADIGRGTKELYTLGRADTDFETPELGRGIAKGFWEQSFVPALFTGRFSEAGRRASDRPFDAMLDALSLGFGGAGTAAKGLKFAARTTDPADLPGFQHITGYRPAKDILSSDDALEMFRPLQSGTLEDFIGKRVGPLEYGDTKYDLKFFGPEADMDGKLRRAVERAYLRPTHRRITVGGGFKADAWSRRSSNELAARIGDVTKSTVGSMLPASLPLVSDVKRTARQLLKGRFSIPAAENDAFTQEYRKHRDEFVKNGMLESSGTLGHGVGRSDWEQAAGEASYWSSMGYNSIDDVIGDRTGFFGTLNTVRVGDDTVLSVNNDGRALMTLAGLMEKQNRLEQRIAEDTKMLADMRAKSGFDDPNVPMVGRANQRASRKQVLESERLLNQSIVRTGMEMNHNKKVMDSLRSAVAEYHNHFEGKSARKLRELLESHSWTKNLTYMEKNRDLINQIMQSDSIEPWLDYLGGSVAPRLEAKYKFNTGGDEVWIDEDMLAQKYRAPTLMGYTLDEAIEKQVRFRKDNPTVLREPIFVPAIKHYDPRVNKGQKYQGEPLLHTDIFDYRERPPFNPENNIFRSDDRRDLNIWLDRYKVENEDFHANNFLDRMAHMGGGWKDYDQIKGKVDEGLITMRRDDGKLLNNSPMVAIAGDSLLARKVRKMNLVLEEIAEHFESAGDKKTADLFRLRTQFLEDPEGERIIQGWLIEKGVDATEAPSAAKRYMADLEKAPNWLQARLGYTGKDKYFVMPRDLYEAMLANVARSENVLLKWMDKPTEIWKNLVLHMRPKWIVNNAVGSALLLALSEGSLDAVRLLFKNSKLRQSIGENIHGPDWDNPDKKFVIKRTEPGTNKIIEDKVTIRDWIQHHFPELTAAHGSSWMYRTELFRDASKGFKARYVRFMDAIADFNARVADDPARLAKATAVFERKISEAREKIREQARFDLQQVDARISGLSERLKMGDVDRADYERLRSELQNQRMYLAQTDELISDGRIAQSLVDNEHIRDEIVDEVLGDLIDFQDLSPYERTVVRSFIPFWTWIKGSSKIGARASFERPWRTGGYRYLGQEADRRLEERYGQLPSFLLGGIPVPDVLQNEAGTRVLGTAGMNPYSTIGDVATIGASLVPGIGARQPLYGSESPIAMANPLLKAGVESLTGRDVFFGTPLRRGVPVGETFLKRMTSFPALNILQKHFEFLPPGRRPQGSKSTAERNLLFDVMGYLGSPTPLDIRLGPARARAREEQREMLPSG